MKNILPNLFILILLLTVLVGVYRDPGVGTASMAGQGRLQTATTTTVGPQTDITLFTAKEYCASRVISTFGVPVVLSFDSTVVNPSGTTGHIQGASTTVAYPSEAFGCGAIVAAAGVSTTIATAEFVY